MLSAQGSEIGSNAAEDKSGVLIVGVGNPLRGDDAAGPMVAAEIARRSLPCLKAVVHAGDSLSLITLWEGARAVILVDAVVSGAPAGTIRRLDLVKDHLPSWLFEVSTHDVGLAQAVELARILNRLPPRLVLYSVEGREFEMGGATSITIQEAVPSVVERVVQEARREVGASVEPANFYRGDT